MTCRPSLRDAALNRRAFTLVELLVVIAIIGILVSLFLPAVQQARRSAARMQSANNLHQIGVALHNHHDVQKVLPAGYLAQTTGPGVNAATLDGPPGWGWGMQLLPYLEYESYFQQLKFDLPAWDPLNAPIVKRRVNVFINPGAPGSHDAMQVKTPSGTLLAEWGRSHYVANVGQDEPWGHVPPLADWTPVSSGPFFRNSKTRLADVTDGLSFTVFIGEHTTVSDKTWVGVHPQAESCPTNPALYPFTTCDRGATLVLCHSGPAASEPGIVHAPSFPTCHVCQMYAPWGGGGLVLFGDGHVQLIPTSINLNTWAALSSMNLKDVPGDF